MYSIGGVTSTQLSELHKKMQKINNRGRFRQMEISELDAIENDTKWSGEASKNCYAYPLQIDSSIAKQEGLRLAIGISSNETYHLESFVCARSPQSHIGPFKYAIDFLVPDGTPVIAAYDGEVTEIQEHSDSWGETSEYRDRLNYITIQHENGEFSQYCHLAKDSVSKSGIHLGSRVTRGQQIALVGKTGWTDRDHLHFIVFKLEKSNRFGFKSLQPQFERE
jgi:murein DD-endopeptidase MepM/ murein hydrolase activator NlpD